MAIKLIEHILFTADRDRVDRQKGIVRSVKVLGRRSRNGREYTPKAMAEAAKWYRNVAVNVNHLGPHGAGADLHGNRKVQDGVGWLENPQVKEDGVYADMHILKSSPHAEMVFEAAERNPNRFGLSHHAYGVGVRKDGKIVVDQITAVTSVDLVQNPATTSGLFEGVDQTQLGCNDIMGSLQETFTDELMSRSEKLDKFGKLLDAYEDLKAAQDAIAALTGGDDPETGRGMSVKDLADQKTGAEQKDEYDAAESSRPPIAQQLKAIPESFNGRRATPEQRRAVARARLDEQLAGPTIRPGGDMLQSLGVKRPANQAQQPDQQTSGGNTLLKALKRK